MSNDCIAYLDSILEKLGKEMLDVAQIQQDMDYVVRVVNEINDKPSVPTPPPPATETIAVIVNPPLFKNQVPLREVKRFNLAGRMIWRVHYDAQGKRICPKRGKRLIVYKDVVKGDGRTFAYQLVGGQVVDGRTIPANLYILARHVE